MNRNPVRIFFLLWNISMFRYLVLGGFIFLLDLTVFIILKKSGLDTRVAQMISRSTGALAGFFIHKYITFRSTDNTSSVLLAQSTGYLVTTLTFIVISPFVVWFFADILRLNLFYAKFFSECILVLGVYFMLNFIFGRFGTKTMP